MNIHFICRGNVLRSLIAETYLKSLKLNRINVISSGTNVNWNDPQERKYLVNTLAVLDRHGIRCYAKTIPNQLTQSRLDSYHDLVILMNQRVIDEARNIVTLPGGVGNWSIVDIGEGHRTNQTHRESYEEEIYLEITQRVDELVQKINKKVI